MKRIMGIDYGDARTGVAISDLLCSIVGSTYVVPSRTTEKAIADIVKLAKDNMVGEIVVMPNDGTISLGYTFSYKYHRKGYAFEALSCLIEELHNRYPDWDFICFTEKENTASRKLLQKLGYKDMGYIEKMESQVYGKWTNPATEKEIAEATK